MQKWVRSLATIRMNRPHNGQPRLPHDNQISRRGNRSGRSVRSQGPSHYNYSVPRTSEVIPGATVSIVLKADQLTGRQVQGEVQDVLTRGNHPRGIKVRLKDGRVGRVQKIVEGISPSIIQNSISSAAAEAKIASVNITDKKRDTRLEEADYQSEPPPRTLAAFFPSVEEQIPDFRSNKISVETVKCPFCGDFEGDEVAVSRHVEEHLI